MSTTSPAIVSAATLRAEAEALRALFEGTYEAWEICGEARRGQPAAHVDHLVRPKFDRGRDLFLERALEGPGREQWSVPATIGESGDPHLIIEICFRGRRHQLQEWPALQWGFGLMISTGPSGYTRMLCDRLRHGRTLTIHDGGVVWFDRSTKPPTMRSVECPTEADFFLMARTKWTPPALRYQRAGQGDYRRGMRREYFPPFVPIRSAGEPATLFRRDKKLTVKRLPAAVPDVPASRGQLVEDSQ